MPRHMEGQLATAALDVPALMAIASGMPRVSARADAPQWAAEPFGESALSNASGRITITAARAALTPSLTARQLRGELRLDPADVVFDNGVGGLAGGRANGLLTLRLGSVWLG